MLASGPSDGGGAIRSREKESDGEAALGNHKEVYPRQNKTESEASTTRLQYGEDTEPAESSG